MDDLQKSELVIAKILNHLMELGIQRGLVDFTEVIDDPALEPFVSSCFYWLDAEGIVRARNYAETKDSFSVVSPSLTSHGYELLGKSFQLKESKVSMSQAVKEVSSGEQSYSQYGDFFGGLLGGFTKSLGS